MEAGGSRRVAGERRGRAVEAGHASAISSSVIVSGGRMRTTLSAAATVRTSAA
jgi:hypothetical protein